MRELLAANPDRSDFLIRLANAQTNLCALIRAQRRYDDCIPLYLEAIDNCLHAICSTLELDKRPRIEKSSDVEGQVAARIGQSVSLRERILADPKLKAKRNHVSQAFAELALNFDDMSAVLTSNSMIKSAELALRESMTLRELVMETWPDDRGIEHYAARGMSNLAQILMDTGRTSEATTLLVKAEQLFSALVADFPDRLHHKREWAFALVAWLAVIHWSKTMPLPSNWLSGRQNSRAIGRVPAGQ